MIVIGLSGFFRKHAGGSDQVEVAVGESGETMGATAGETTAGISPGASGATAVVPPTVRSCVAAAGLPADEVGFAVRDGVRIGPDAEVRDGETFTIYTWILGG